jgi:hypothetical protein
VASLETVLLLDSAHKTSQRSAIVVGAWVRVKQFVFQLTVLSDRFNVCSMLQVLIHNAVKE